jgi:TonB family protein
MNSSMSLNPMSTGSIAESDKYRPILEIGQGGMSRVYLALFRGPGDFNKLRVVKRLLPTLAADPEFLEMFLEEARLSARLNHANIVQINEVGFDGTHHYMAMEYLEGQSLDSVVRVSAKRGDFPIESHLRIIADACAGLHHAHELADIDGKPLNIVHRDVSPHNVFVTYAGQVKVLDFGIAKAADSSHHTRTGVLKGKCAYMAPEQFRNEAIDRRADIFALGIMTWQAVTRTRMWRGLSDIEIFHRLATGEIPSVQSVAPDTPPALIAICERALAPKLEHRYGTAAELGEAIEGYLASLPNVPAPREIGRSVAELFAEGRAKVKAAIEAEVKRADNMPLNSAEIPIFVDPNAGSDEDGGQDQGMGIGMVGSGGYERAQAMQGGYADSQMGKDGSVRTLKRVVIGGAVVVLLMAAALVMLTIARRRQPPEPVAKVEEQTVLPVPSGPMHGDRNFITLRVKADPPSAVISVDGVKVSSNPGQANLSRDTAEHVVRATAPGYKAEEKSVKYDEDEKSVEFDLEKEPAVAFVAHPQPKHPGDKSHPNDHTGSKGEEKSTSTSAPSTPQPATNNTGAVTTTQTPSTAPTSATPTAPAAVAPKPGTVDPKKVTSTFAQHRAEIQSCYDRANMGGAGAQGLAGTVNIAATLNPDGGVSEAHVASSTVQNPRLESCLVDRVKSWTFTPPAGGVSGNFTKALHFD